MGDNVLTPCIEWPGVAGTGKYGHCKFNGKFTKAHRAAYCKHHGLQLADIEGQNVLHACDNPPCVNPEHLSLGDDIDNAKDRDAKGRQTKGEQIAWSVLTADQVREIKQMYIPRHKEYGARALGRRFGVKHQTISDIFRGKNWKHIK